MRAHLRANLLMNFSRYCQLNFTLKTLMKKRLVHEKFGSLPRIDRRAVRNAVRNVYNLQGYVSNHFFFKINNVLLILFSMMIRWFLNSHYLSDRIFRRSDLARYCGKVVENSPYPAGKHWNYWEPAVFRPVYSIWEAIKKNSILY